MTTVEVESNKPRLQCRDCDFSTMNVAEFSDHIEVCKVNPVVRVKEPKVSEQPRVDAVGLAS